MMTEQKIRQGLPDLDPKHYKELSEGSAIPDEMIAERGAYTIRTKTELKRLGFSAAQQQVPAIGFPIHDVGGKYRFTIIKPDHPRVDRKNGGVRKYEIPAKQQMTIDVPERCREHADDASIPAAFTEGIKKVMALAALGKCCAMGVVGVWNWRGTNEKDSKVSLADLERIAWKNKDEFGRKTYLIFDSDIMQKREVYNALKRFRNLLLRLGADVWIVYLPDGLNGEKMGIDDYLALGHTWDDVKALARRELREPPKESISGRDFVSKHLPDAPVSEDFVVPAGYEALRGGIIKYATDSDNFESKTIQVTSEPILIAGRSQDVNSGSEFAELVYVRGGEWRRI